MPPCLKASCHIICATESMFLEVIGLKGSEVSIGRSVGECCKEAWSNLLDISEALVPMLSLEAA